MLKERFENVKKFVKRHKKDILLGAICLGGTIVGCKLMKDMNNEYKANIERRNNYIEAYNRAADRANNDLIPKINAKYEEYDFSKREIDPEIKAVYNQYIGEYQNEFDKMLEEELNR